MAIVLLLISSLISLYFILRLYQQFVEYKLNVLLIMLIINSLVILTNIIKILNLHLNPNIALNPRGISDIVLGILSSFLILVFLNYYQEDRLSGVKMIFATFFALSTLYSFSEGLLTEVLQYNLFVYLVVRFSPSIFFLYIIIITTVTINSIKQYLTADQQNNVELLRWFIYFAFGGNNLIFGIAGVTFPASVVEFSLFQKSWILLLPQIVYISSGILFYFGYIRPNNPAILQPLRINRLVIMTNQGLPVYQLKIDTDAPPLDEALLSGSLTAISSVVKEATNIIGEIKSIQIGNQHMILQKSETMTAVIFAYQPTDYLLDAITKLANKSSELELIDQSGEIPSEEISKFDDYVHQILGYSKK